MLLGTRRQNARPDFELINRTRDVIYNLMRILPSPSNYIPSLLIHIAVIFYHLVVTEHFT